MGGIAQQEALPVADIASIKVHKVFPWIIAYSPHLQRHACALDFMGAGVAQSDIHGFAMGMKTMFRNAMVLLTQ